MSEGIVSEEGSFKNADGKNIFTKYWKPGIERPRALIFITHGFGEHCSRYERLGTALAEQGYFVFSQDHVGHGKSEGERAQVKDFAHYTRDVFKHIDQVTADNTGIPIFIFGHSMGGTIAVLCVLDRPDFFTGAILSAPSIKLDQNACVVCLGKIAAWLVPSYQVLPSIDPSVLSRDPLQVEKYANDPLNWHEGVKARFGVAFLDAMYDIQNRISKLTVLYLLIHGDNDQLVKIDSSNFLHKNSSSTDKTYKVYKGGRHELLNEVEETAGAVYKDILDWIQQKLP